MKMKAVTSEENAMFQFFVSVILKIIGYGFCILTILEKTSFSICFVYDLIRIKKA